MSLAADHSVLVKKAYLGLGKALLGGAAKAAPRAAGPSFRTFAPSMTARNVKVISPLGPSMPRAATAVPSAAPQAAARAAPQMPTAAPQSFGRRVWNAGGYNPFAGGMTWGKALKGGLAGGALTGTYQIGQFSGANKAAETVGAQAAETIHDLENRSTLDWLRSGWQALTSDRSFGDQAMDKFRSAVESAPGSGIRDVLGRHVMRTGLNSAEQRLQELRKANSNL